VKRGSNIAGLIAIILAWIALHASGFFADGAGRVSSIGQDHGQRFSAQSIGASNGGRTGTVRTTVVGCEDRANSYDQVRYIVRSAARKIVAQKTMPVLADPIAATGMLHSGR